MSEALCEEIEIIRELLNTALARLAFVEASLQPPRPAYNRTHAIVSGKYFLVFKGRPGFEPGVYNTKRAYVAAIELEEGTYSSRSGEVIVLHPSARVDTDGYNTVGEADTRFRSVEGYDPTHHW